MSGQISLVPGRPGIVNDGSLKRPPPSSPAPLLAPPRFSPSLIIFAHTSKLVDRFSILAMRQRLREAGRWGSNSSDESLSLADNAFVRDGQFRGYPLGLEVLSWRYAYPCSDNSMIIIVALGNEIDLARLRLRVRSYISRSFSINQEESSTRRVIEEDRYLSTRTL